MEGLFQPRDRGVRVQQMLERFQFVQEGDFRRLVEQVYKQLAGLFGRDRPSGFFFLCFYCHLKLIVGQAPKLCSFSSKSSS